MNNSIFRMAEQNKIRIKFTFGEQRFDKHLKVVSFNFQQFPPDIQNCIPNLIAKFTVHFLHLQCKFKPNLYISNDWEKKSNLMSGVKLCKLLRYNGESNLIDFHGDL